MHWISVSVFINLLLLSLLSIQFISSASFPTPLQRPPADASPDEKALFWKLLHNYYAIMARPRFGKRFDSTMSHSKYPSFVRIVNRNYMPSEDETNHVFNENTPEANDRRVNMDNIYTFEYLDRRRR